MTNKLYFVSGASGSGKTAIKEKLGEIFDNSIDIYDFDDIGVPQNPDKVWRQESTEKWLKKLIKESNDICLLGQTVLGEILACPSAKDLEVVNFCLLDVEDEERGRRLKERTGSMADQETFNWAAWLRMHNQDPAWMQHVVKKECWPELDFSSWENLKEWKHKANVGLVNTTQFSIEETAELVANWLVSARILDAKRQQQVENNKQPN